MLLSSLVLAAALSGQCAGNSCSLPQRVAAFAPRYVQAPASPRYSYPSPAYYYVVAPPQVHTPAPIHAVGSRLFRRYAAPACAAVSRPR